MTHAVVVSDALVQIPGDLFSISAGMHDTGAFDQWCCGNLLGMHRGRREQRGDQHIQDKETFTQHCAP